MILYQLRNTIIKSRLVNELGEDSPLLATYPSQQWGVKSWSYRLVEELLLKYSLLRSRLTQGNGWRMSLADWLTNNAWCFHHDAEYKALLFTALSVRHNQHECIIVLPEVGPFGLDLLMARAAGFTRFIAYDKDQLTIDTCRAFHVGVEVEYSVATSAEFDFSPYTSPHYLIVFPDWPHDDLKQRLNYFENVLRYSYRSRKDEMGLKQIQDKLGVRHLKWRELFDALDKLY